MKRRLLLAALALTVIATDSQAGPFRRRAQTAYQPSYQPSYQSAYQPYSSAPYAAPSGEYTATSYYTPATSSDGVVTGEASIATPVAGS